MITKKSTSHDALRIVLVDFFCKEIKNWYSLIYLENFAPDEARERFEERIRSLFETKWIIELVDMAMLKMAQSQNLWDLGLRS